jgi:hypothetical protein
MHIELPTPRDMLNFELVTSPPKKKSRTTFGSLVNDSKKDEEQTCSNEIGGKGGEELDAIAMQGNIEEKPKPNLDHIIDNIQIELVVSVEHVISITKCVVASIKSFQHVQLVI